MRVSLAVAAHVLGAAAVAFVAVDPALASAPIPGPLLGAGAPVLALFAAGYYLLRKRRMR